MKKSILSCIVVLILVVSLTVTSYATAEFTGKIWTNKPTILGIGYYCTAARNDSKGDTIHCAEAESFDASGQSIVKSKQYGNTAAVANSGDKKPNSGVGSYWEEYSNGNIMPGCKSSCSFVSGAYD